MKYFWGLFIFLSCSLTVFGQKNLSLSGTLLDKTTSETIIAASVELLNVKDSAYVAGAFSSPDGYFALKELSKGNYILHVTYLGYTPVYQKISLTGNPSSLNLGKILMETDAILLKEAVVEGKKPEIVVKNDTIEYDAGSYKTTENAVVEDLLKKLPGVEVDKEGKITVGGKEVKKFLVDGKEFFSDDPKVASKNLPAEMVDKLQVVDRKSEMARLTGFDDGEEETVINLTIRSGMKQGTMGNVLGGLGADVEKDKDSRYQAGAFLNHMKNSDRYTLIVGANNNNNMGASDLGANQFGGMRMRRGPGGGAGITESENVMFNMNKEFSTKLSLNTDIRYNGMDRDSKSKNSETTLSDKQSQLDNSLSTNNYISDNFSINMRLEWKPDSSNTFIFRPNFRYNTSKSDETTSLDRLDYYTNDTILNSFETSNNKGDGYSIGGNLDYSHRFSKAGRTLTIGMGGSYGDSYSQENSNSLTRNFTNGLYSNEYELDQRMENDDNSKNYQATVSFVEPLGRNNFMQFSYRISHSNSESLNSTYDLHRFDLLNQTISPVDTAVIRPNQSRSTDRNSTEQRYTVSFKAVREKYNYTIGFNVDPTRSNNLTYQPYAGSQPSVLLPYPFSDRLPNVMGDSLVSEIPLNVVNFSPVINFNYRFGQRSDLRIDYEGSTNQPSASQLRDYTDTSSPTNWVKGNPNLKPGYTNSLSARFNKYVPATQLMYGFNLRGGYSLNDISSVTEMLDGGIRLTSYENVNGNWNAQASGMFNTPLKNKKFTVATFMMSSFRNSKSFVNEMENTMKNLSVMVRPNINYRSDLFDLGLNGNIRYGKIEYSVQPERNQETFDCGVGANTTWYLPYKLTLESDFSWTVRSGYATGYNIPEAMWNASLTKQLFSKRIGTGSLKLQIYDILKDRNSISASYTTNGFRSSEVNTIPSFFMCSFIYKFSVFPKGSSATESDVRDGGREGGRGGWRGGPGGGGSGGSGGPGGGGGGMF